MTAACGPVIGGVLVSEVGWRSVFWVNVPIGAAMNLAARRYVPESRTPHPRRVDVPGPLPMIALLGTLTYAVIQGPDRLDVTAASWRRSRVSPAMITEGDAAWRAFRDIGWTWGGDWRSLKDYMHFSANGL